MRRTWAPRAIDLDVAQGLGHAEQLDVDLVELALTALLRLFVAEHGAAVEVP